MHVARRAATLALAALAAGCATGRYTVKGRPVPYQGFFATFPSGMRLVVYEMPQAGHFMFAASYRAGSVDDPPGKEGLAHLAEHLAFRGRPGGKGTPRVWDRLVASGWRWNAFTTPDATDFWEMGTPQDLRAALDLEADRMRDPLAAVSDDDFKVEREVVLSEYRERFETDPAGSELRWVVQAALPGHPYDRPAAGTPESLARISLADVRAWVRQRYAAQGAVLVLVSHRPAREVAAEVADAFRELTGEGSMRVEPVKYQPPSLPDEPRVQRELQRHTAPVDYPQLWVAWPVPGYHARGVPQTAAVSAVLGEAVRDRLWKWWEQGVVHHFRTGLVLHDGAALLCVRVELDKAEDAERVAEAVRFAGGELRVSNLQAFFRNQVIEWLRDRLLVEAYRDLEQVYAPAVARFVRSYGQPDYLRGWSAMVAQQLVLTVDAYADRFLAASRSAAVLVEPDRNTGSAPAQGAGAAVRAENPVPAEEELAGMAPPSPPRIAGAARAPGLDRAERRTLPNGLEVVLARRGAIPVADVRLVLRTDGEGTPGSPAGVRRLAMAASGALFAEWRQVKLGAESFEEVSPDAVVLGARGSSGNLEGLIDSVAEWGQQLRTGRTDMALKALKRHLYRDWHRTSRRAQQVLLAALFPDHPYGTILTGKLLDQYGFADAGAWLDRQMRPERATLVVASDVAPSPELWAFVEGQFGGWKKGDAGPPQPAAEPPPPARRRVILVERPGATQALLWLGVRGPARASRDEPALDAVQWLIGSRLQQRLRVEQGVSYGIHVRRRDLARGSAVLVAAAVDRDSASRSLGQMLGALAGLAGSPVSPLTATWAGWQVARDRGFRFDTVEGAADALQELALDRRPPDWFERQPESIVGLDSERIQAAARSLAVGREAVVVVGDRAALEPQLRKAGYPVEVVPEPPQR